MIVVLADFISDFLAANNSYVHSRNFKSVFDQLAITPAMPVMFTNSVLLFFRLNINKLPLLIVSVF